MPSSGFRSKAFFLVLLAAALLLSPVLRRARPGRVAGGAAALPASTAASVAAGAMPAPSATAALPTTPDYPAASGPVLRPLAIAKESALHAWTEEDARLPQVIGRIAHNPDEAAKMLKENERIKRRQLVYRKDTVAAMLQRARLTGERLQRLTLPAFDGEEVEVVVDRADLSPSGQSGSLVGHLADEPGSTVTLAFQFGHEAFSVSSPQDDLYILADPREPGEVILKSIDPATYVPGVCGNPDYLASK